MSGRRLWLVAALPLSACLAAPMGPSEIDPLSATRTKEERELIDTARRILGNIQTPNLHALAAGGAVVVREQELGWSVAINDGSRSHALDQTAFLAFSDTGDFVSGMLVEVHTPGFQMPSFLFYRLQRDPGGAVSAARIQNPMDRALRGCQDCLLSWSSIVKLGSEVVIDLTSIGSAGPACTFLGLKLGALSAALVGPFAFAVPPTFTAACIPFMTSALPFLLHAPFQFLSQLLAQLACGPVLGFCGSGDDKVSCFGAARWSDVAATFYATEGLDFKRNGGRIWNDHSFSLLVAGGPYTAAGDPDPASKEDWDSVPMTRAGQGVGGWWERARGAVGQGLRWTNPDGRIRAEKRADDESGLYIQHNPSGADAAKGARPVDVRLQCM